MTRPTRNRFAFTLIEVMLAMSILMLVVAAIYATWRVIIGATQSSHKAAAEVQRSRVAMRCLEQALTYTVMHAANPEYYWFAAENGSDAMLSFAANLPGDFPRSGRFGDFTVRRVQFSIEPGKEGGRELVLRQAPLLMDFDLDEQEYPLVLMKNVRKMELEFWDSQRQDWTEEWTLTNQVPKLVRVFVATENPRSTFERGEEYTRLVSPASAAVQAAWQAVAPAGAPPGAPPPGGNPILPPPAPPR